MARTPRPWFWAERQVWAVNRDGKRHPLGPHPAGFPPPQKVRGRWNAPDPIVRAFHALMARPMGFVAPAAADRVAVATLIERYLEWCKLNREPRTYDGYLWHLQAFCDHLAGPGGINPRTFPAADLKPFHVVGWVGAHPDWGQTYRRNAIAAVKRAYSWGEEMGYLTTNPLRRVKRPSAARREQFVTPDEWVLIRDSYEPGDPFRLYLEFCWETGCRPQEARVMEPRHVRLDKALVAIPPKEAKGRKQWRLIRLEGRALELVRQLVSPRRERVFLNEDGIPWTSSAVNCRFKRLKTKLGKGYCAYSLRHGFCQRMLVSGVDHLTVAALLGHADGTMVAKVYSHLDQDDRHLREVLRQVGDGLSKEAS